MKRKLQLCRIVARSMLKKNIGNFLFVLCIIILTASPIILYGTSQSIMNQVFESKKDVYGNYSDIYYENHVQDDAGLNFTQANLDVLIPGFHYQNFGTLYTVYTENLESEQINLGYADATALSLGRVKLIQGVFPAKKTEIALTSGLMKTLDVQELGDPVVIDQTEYTVVGIVEDYGYLWPKGEKQISEQTGTIHAFVSKEQAESIYSEYGQLSRQILIVREPGISNQTESNEDFFYNNNAQLTEQGSVFSVPTSFLFILYFCSVMIFYNVLALSRKRLCERIRVYELLGMIKKELRFCVGFEFYTLGMIALLLGGIIGYAGIRISLWSLSNSTGSTFSANFHWSVFGGIGVLLLTSIIFSVYLYTFLVVRSVQESKSQHRPMKKRKGVFHLSFLEFHQNKGVMISFVLLISFSFVLLSYVTFYQKAFTKTVEYTSNIGLLPIDYDFEFVTVPISGVPGNNDTIYLGDSYELDGAKENVVQALEKEDNVAKVLPFKENNKMDILISADAMDRYLDASDFNEDGEYYSYSELRPEMKELFAYQDDYQLINSKLLGYPEEVLQDLSKYIVEGKLNLNKIASGEEVILMVPAFSLRNVTIGGSTGVAMSFPDYQSDNVYNDTIFKVGDEITLSGLVTQERFHGAVSEEEAVKSYQRKDVKVKIGAIIRSRVGWFARSTQDDVYTILTLNEAFDALGIPATYNRIWVYTDNGADPQKMSESMASYMANLPYMMLDDLQSELVSYKRLDFVIDIFLVSLMILVIIIDAICLSSQMLTKTQLNMKKYALLRINGLSVRRIIRTWWLQCAVLAFIGLLPGIAAAAAVLSLSFHMSVPALISYISWGKWAAIILLLGLLIGVSLIPSIVYIKRRQDDIISRIY